MEQSSANGVDPDDDETEAEQGNTDGKRVSGNRPVLLVWGCGEFGQHGHGHRDDVHCGDPDGRWIVPKAMQLDCKRIEQAACGASHTLVLLGRTCSTCSL